MCKSMPSIDEASNRGQASLSSLLAWVEEISLQNQVCLIAGRYLTDFITCLVCWKTQLLKPKERSSTYRLA
jgi:hypothetical protein